MPFFLIHKLLQADMADRFINFLSVNAEDTRVGQANEEKHLTAGGEVSQKSEDPAILKN